MKGIHLYHFSQSNCSMRIRLLLDYNRFPFEDFPRALKWIDRFVNRPSYEAAVTRWFDYVPAQNS